MDEPTQGGAPLQFLGGEGPVADSLYGHRKQRGWRRLARIGLAIVLLLIGVVEVFIPGPAIFFFAVGTALLAPDFPPARRLMLGVYRRWPEVRRRIPARFRRLGRRGPPRPDRSAETSE